MAYTTIDNPVEYFSATLYTGNGTARTIATGHQSDWVWLKRRDGAAGHRIADSVRGATKLLYADSDTSEQTDAKSITGFVSTGFTLGDDANGYDVNTNTNTMVAWSWKAGGSASSNSNGSITSSVSASTDAGFSIVSYTGTGSDANVGHGLSSAPELIITKSRSTTGDWKVHTSAIDGSWDVGTLNSTSAFGNSSYTASTNSIFYVGSGAPTNASSVTYVSYLLHSVKGYSKIGSYQGNGNADGAFVYTGFKPAWLLAKKSSGTGDWFLIDNKRSTINPTNHQLEANSTAAEDASGRFNFLSSGFKCVSDSTGSNGSGTTYIFIAFAESPFTNSNGVPNNAR